jgi:hypothetical protein
MNAMQMHDRDCNGPGRADVFRVDVKCASGCASRTSLPKRFHLLSANLECLKQSAACFVNRQRPGQHIRDLFIHVLGADLTGQARHRSPRRFGVILGECPWA